MIRKLLAACTSAALMAILLLGVVATPVAAQGGDCQEVFDGWDSGVNNGDFAGERSFSGIESRSGARATFTTDNASTGFKMCQQTSTDITNNGVLGYIEAYPRIAIGGCSAGPDSNCYIRFGVARCIGDVGGPKTYCQSPTERKFMERRGCGAATVVHDYGTTPDSNTDMYFYRDAANHVQFYADSVHHGDVPTSDSRLSCWYTGTNAVGIAYFFRALDEGDASGVGGDSLGTINTAATGLYGAQYGVWGGGWFDTNWGTGACEFEGTDQTCDRILDGETLRVFTSTGGP